jgi:hypothetical protein
VYELAVRCLETPTRCRDETSCFAKTFEYFAFLPLVVAQAFVPHNFGNKKITQVVNCEASTARKMSTSAISNSDTAVIQGDSKVLHTQQVALDNTWIAQLSPETLENFQKSCAYERLSPDDANQNQTKRPVYNGHYVSVAPTGLTRPRLVVWSKDVAQRLHLSQEQVESKDFLEYVLYKYCRLFRGYSLYANRAGSRSHFCSLHRWVSGNRVLGPTWATPYALSIMGTRYSNNCPYGTGEFILWVK